MSRASAVHNGTNREGLFIVTTTIRRWHGYIGLFIGPSVLFFALTGAVQLFSLHEAHGSYQPPAIIEKLSSVHKDQVFALGHHHDGPPPVESAAAKPDTVSGSTVGGTAVGGTGVDGTGVAGTTVGGAGVAGTAAGGAAVGGPHEEAKDEDDDTDVKTYVLKGYFLIVALGLSVSTGFGLWMGFRYTVRKRLAWLLVTVGTLLPLSLLVL